MYPPSNRISCIPVLPSRGPGRTAHTAHTGRCLLWGRSLPRDARRQQVHVSPYQRLAAIKPRSSEPAGLCLCSQPYTHPKCQSEELGASRSLSLLTAILASKVPIQGARSPQVSVSAPTKAQSQHHESMQPMQPADVHATPPYLQLPGIPAAESSEPGAAVSVSAQCKLGASQGLCLRLLQEMVPSTKTLTKPHGVTPTLPSCLPPTSASLHHTPSAPSRTDRRLLPRRATASARLARRLDPPSTNHHAAAFSE